jgi:CRISPR-associated endonuclease Csn1
MSKKDVDNIVDKPIREAVQQQLERLGGTPEKAFKDAADLPYVTTGDGRINLIKKARVRVSAHPMAVGEGSKTRYVNPGSNHHMEIVAVLDDNGNETKWEGILVSRFEAQQRHRRGEPIIETNHLPERRFLFSISSGEHVMMDIGDEEEVVLRVVSISRGSCEFVRISDARPKHQRSKVKGARITSSPSMLSQRDCKKVNISPLGSIVRCND